MSVAWSIPWKGAGRLNRPAEDGPAYAARIDVVEIIVQLRDHADIAAALAVDRDQRLDAELERVADPNDARIDGAGRRGSRCQRVRHRRLQGRLHQRDQVIDE